MKLSREFITRRVHSFAGFGFLLFLCEHLFTNAQAGLLSSDNGAYFIRSVNFIYSLPFLPAIELSLIALPALVHTWWGLERVLISKPNSMDSDGSQPSLKFPKNRAYTWQRITAVLLIAAICFHVGSMRFYRSPMEQNDRYAVTISHDPALEMVTKRLDIEVEQRPSGEVVARAPTVGAAMLVMMRDTFKSLGYCIGYSLFVLLTAFHACNGLWTLAVTWGFALTDLSRNRVRLFCNLLMVILSFFGLACVWGLYYGI